MWNSTKFLAWNANSSTPLFPSSFTFSFVNVMSSRLVLNLHSLRQSDEDTYWGHNTTTNNTSGMELKDWPASPGNYTAFPQRGSLKAAQRRFNGSGRNLGPRSQRSTGWSTPNSTTLFIPPLERSQNSPTREMEMDIAADKRPVRETDLGTVSITSHRGGSSQARIISPLPPLKVKVDVDVDFDIEIASASPRSSWKSDGRNSPTPPPSCWHYGEAI